MTSKAYHELHDIKNMTNSKNKGIRTRVQIPPSSLCIGDHILQLLIEIIVMEDR